MDELSKAEAVGRLAGAGEAGAQAAAKLAADMLAAAGAACQAAALPGGEVIGGRFADPEQVIRAVGDTGSLVARTELATLLVAGAEVLQDRIDELAFFGPGLSRELKSDLQRIDVLKAGRITASDAESILAALDGGTAAA